MEGVNFKCLKCRRGFVKRGDLTRHMNSCPQANVESDGIVFKCAQCGNTYTRKDSLAKHVKSMHGKIKDLVYACGLCSIVLPCSKEMSQHRKEHLIAGPSSADSSDVEERETGFVTIESAHNRKARLLRYTFPEEIAFPDEALRHVEPRLERLLKLNQQQHTMYKVGCIFSLEFVKISEEGEMTMQSIVPVRAKSFAVMPLREVREPILDVSLQIMETIDKFLLRGSGWTVNDILSFDVEISECKPMVGSCGLHGVTYVRKRGIEFELGGFKNSALDEEEEDDYDALGQLSAEDEARMIFALGEGTSLPSKRAKISLGTVEDRYCCFYLAVASHFVAIEEREKATNISPHARQIRMWELIREMDCCVPAPVKLEEIHKFEAANLDTFSISINVVYRDEGGIFPVYASRNIAADNCIVLVMGLTVDEHNGREMHFARVEEPNKLFAPRRKTESSGKTRPAPAFFCWNCCNYQQREESHKEHVSWCHLRNSQRVILPKPGEVVTYDKEKLRPEASYLLFFDFETLSVTPDKTCSCSESVLEATREAERQRSEMEMETLLMEEEDKKNLKLLEQQTKEGKLGARALIMWKKRQLKIEQHRASSGRQKKTTPRLCTHKSKILKEQPAFAYSIVLLDRTGKVVKDLCYVGDDAAAHFISTLLDLEEEYLEPLDDGGEPMEALTPQMERHIASAEDCYLCGEPLENDRTRDHDHITGKFLGVAHNWCNLLRRECLKITCFAHNFSGYDSHLIIRALNQFNDRIEKPAAIPLNTQKFKMLRFNRIQMLDSAAFLGDSLDRLVGTLVASNHSFPILSTRWAKKSERELVLRKGVFPYGFCESIELLKNTCHLPPKEAFFNAIGDLEISSADYSHASLVWDHFECADMIDYAKLYVTTDTYLLAEVVMDLREMVAREFGLEIANYLSLPMLTKDIMLKTSGVKMELVADQVSSTRRILILLAYCTMRCHFPHLSPSLDRKCQTCFRQTSEGGCHLSTLVTTTPPTQTRAQSWWESSHHPPLPPRSMLLHLTPQMLMTAGGSAAEQASHIWTPTTYTARQCRFLSRWMGFAG